MADDRRWWWRWVVSPHHGLKPGRRRSDHDPRRDTRSSGAAIDGGRPDQWHKDRRRTRLLGQQGHARRHPVHDGDDARRPHHRPNDRRSAWGGGHPLGRGASHQGRGWWGRLGLTGLGEKLDDAAGRAGGGGGGGGRVGVAVRSHLAAATDRRGCHFSSSSSGSAQHPQQLLTSGRRAVLCCPQIDVAPSANNSNKTLISNCFLKKNISVS